MSSAFPAEPSHRRLAETDVRLRGVCRFGETDFGDRLARLDEARSHVRRAKSGGEGGIRTHVPLTGQDAFEAPPLRPLRYLSVRQLRVERTFHYTGPRAPIPSAR